MATNYVRLFAETVRRATVGHLGEDDPRQLWQPTGRLRGPVPSHEARRPSHQHLQQLRPPVHDPWGEHPHGPGQPQPDPPPAQQPGGWFYLVSLE